MSVMSFNRLLTRLSAAGVLLVLLSSPAHSITGGVSVDEVLGGENATPDQKATATDVAAVTVPLVRLDATGRVLSLCSSTLIHPRAVLTAAHCVFDGGHLLDGLTILFPNGTDRPARRQAIDMVVHPTFVAIVQRAFRPGKEDIRSFIAVRGVEVLMSDLALVLLHRPAPETHDPVGMVASGFRDDRGTRKVIAGYGRVGKTVKTTGLDLRFADLRGNTRDHRGIFSGGSEIVMESYYKDGAKVNVCSGDSGGPVLALERGGTRMRQIAVTSAADLMCRDVAIFAPIDAQRPMLRQMFETLMEGEEGAERNPF